VKTQADDLPSGRKIGPSKGVCSVLLRLTALAGILRLLAGFLIWSLTLLAPASDLDFDSAGRLGSDC
jgi:hypothetical protein